MTDLSTVLTELLFDRDAVIVPGLGMFVRQDDSAKVNVITNHFERPSSTITFDARQREENDLLAKAIEAYEGCTADEARQRVSQFVMECFETFKQGGEVKLDGLGVLSMEDDETLRFEQEQDANFNGDAFGLGDFNPTPVNDSDTGEDWKAQVVRQNKDKNTPMTVDRKAMDFVDEEEEYYRRRRRTRYVLFTLLLAIPVVLLLLHFMEIIHLKSPFPIRVDDPTAYDLPMVETEPVHVAMDSALYAALVRYDEISVVAEKPGVTDTLPVNDSLVANQDVEQVEPTPSPAQVELKYSIIGGCFSQKENADNQVASLREQGYADADVVLRGQHFYVCYARFATLEEAKAELGKIRTNSNNKAWILDK